MQPTCDDRKGDSVALVRSFLMLLWGLAPSARRPPRVMLERQTGS
jgi:hypothetical protein